MKDEIKEIDKDLIAVVGLAFRFPGDFGDQTQFWQALQLGRDLVGSIDPSRWDTSLLSHPKPSEPGRSKTFAAGVLSNIDQFDADFFGISPREAAWLDPQQRLLLELAWESMENGGILPGSMAGSDCSVFVGISGVDYGMRAIGDLSSISSHSMTGNTLSIAANRLSYTFDLHGPSVAVDTACSSSLVALHQACNSLRAGECSMAMVGGVNLLLHPYPFVGFTKASMLSAEERCRAFDASANGYVRGEGGAVVLLKPLRQALADGNIIEAVILATGVNADGGRKTGLTIPSSEGQAELMRAVLSRSGLSSDDVDYVEAHGTGTAVGDPIESAAIGKVYGQSRKPGHPLPIGSVKTNVGHLEAASGMAGLVKSILVLKNRAVPPSLHLVKPNPNIDFAGLNIEVATQLRPLSRDPSKKLVVGVNSFGFGGANAHVLMQEYCLPKQVPQRRAVKKPPLKLAQIPPLFLSARNPQALRDLAALYALALKQEPLSYYDISHSAVVDRDRMEMRCVVEAQDTAHTIGQLDAFARGETAPSVLLENAGSGSGSVAFVYSGNGSQWHGMGQKLLAESPRFTEIITELDALIFTRSGISVITQLQVDATSSQLENTAVAQPLLFAIQVAVTTMLREFGIAPKAVVGHSVGEVAAAWAAGALSMDQAVEVICVRSAAQALTRGTGRMAAVGLSVGAVREWIASGNFQEIEIAGINSQSNVTVSGPLDVLEQFGLLLQQRGLFFRLLDLDYAFHSRFMDPIEDALKAKLANLAPGSCTSAVFVSTVTGTVLDGAELGASYWWRNVRQPILFMQAIASTVATGCRVYIEIGPHAILQRYLAECLTAAETASRVLPTLRRGNDGLEQLSQTALRAHLLVEPHQLNVFFPVPGHSVRLPNYPWQRERHWHPQSSDSFGLLDNRRVHPLLGWRLKSTAAAWENVLDSETLPWLAHHKVAGATVLPGAAYIEMALVAARAHFGGNRQEIEQLDILSPIVFDGDHARSLRFEIAVRDGSFQILSRQRLSEDEWTLNAVGRLLGAPTGAYQASTDKASANKELPVLVDHDTHYRLTAVLGLDYGPTFRGFGHAAVRDQTLTAAFEIPKLLADVADLYAIHPALLDVCFQSLVDFFQDEIQAGDGLPLLPVKVGRLRHFTDAPPVQFRSILKRQSVRSVLADFHLLDAAGNIVAVLEDCRFRAAAVQRRKQADPACWRAVPRLQPLAVQQLQTRLPSRTHISQQLDTWFIAGESQLDRNRYFKDARPLFEALTLSFIQNVFLGLAEKSGNQLLISAHQKVQIEPGLQPLFGWMVSVLLQEAILVEHSSGAWQLELTDLPAAQDIWRTLLRDYPTALPELVLIARVGLQLPDMLRANTSSASMAADLRQSHQTETLFDDSLAYIGTRLAIEQTLSVVAAQWPANRRLRILEIAAGNSALVQQLSHAFPDVRLDYVVAHDSDESHARLSVEYAGHPFVVVAKITGDRLDLSADPVLPEIFDVIIFRHALHRSVRPASVLLAARHKLAAGGLLILAERHPDAAADFMFGLDALWWRTSQGEVTGSSLLAPVTWEHTLLDQGFADVGTYQEPASAGLNTGAYVVLAKRPEDESLPVGAPTSATWLLVCEDNRQSQILAENLCTRLQTQHQDVRIQYFCAGGESSRLNIDIANNGVDSHPGSQACISLADALLNQTGGGIAKADHVVYLAGSNSPSCVPDLLQVQTDAPENNSGAHVIAITRIVQSLGRTTPQPRLWLLTAGGALVEGLSHDVPPQMQQGAVWGFGRVVMNEYPGLSCTLIDMDLDPSSDAAGDQLQKEFLHPDGEQEIVLTARGRFGLRMERVSSALARSPATAGSRFRLDFRVPGQLRNLIWLHQPEPAVRAGDIEVRVVATGLNFRDVMYLMGLLPDEAVENGYAGATLGLEFSGIVTRVGSTGSGFSVGEAVMGFGSACFASHVVSHTTSITHKPAHWSFESAATVPTVFFTVYYALKHLANVQPGERILIHGAAGGVGIAAVQMALHLGAEIYATVGSSEKRDFVSLLGADHVFDSRSLAFADDILALTDGKGVDVVLNSLAGEAIRRNLHVLAPFGRFLELGKRDFFENTPIGLRPFKDNITYFGIDADQLLSAKPALAGRLFKEVMGLFQQGVLFPLPYRVFTASHIVDAFRAMQQARQIGKVVVVIDGSTVNLEPQKNSLPKISFDKTAMWLVTGGLEGFGLESARWLTERGVGHLVLTGRRGMATPGAKQAVEAFRTLGVRVTVFALDVTDPSATSQMLFDICLDGSTLNGVLHAATVIDDALIDNLDADRINKVLAPKMLGAWNLHHLTKHMSPAHFVLYSSVTTSIGNPGQANYVAANASLESLARLRKSMGMPVTCIGWGPIGDAGYLTRNQAVKDSLSTRMGAEPMSAHEALNTLDDLLIGQACTTTVANFTWPALSKYLPSAHNKRFDSLRRQAGPLAASVEGSEDIKVLIAGKSLEEVRQVVRGLVLAEVAQVLFVSAERIDSGRSLHDLGMDSLMGVELALGLEKRFGVQLPAMMLSEGPTVDKVTSRIVDRVMAGHLTGQDMHDVASAETADGVDVVVAQLALQHGAEVSEEQIAQVKKQVRMSEQTGSFVE